MSVSVYILVQTVHDKGMSAAEAIGKLQYVTSVEFLEGPYDVIAKAEVPSDDELGKFLLTQVMHHLHDQFFTLVEVPVLQDTDTPLLLERLGFQKVDVGHRYSKK